MKLEEVLSSTYKFALTDGDEPKEYEATFKCDDGSFVVVKFEWWSGPELYEVHFARDGDWDMTGGGDALKIFGTVIKIIKTFLAETKPKFLGFSANKEEQSRVAFYGRLVKKVLPGMNYEDVTNSLDRVDHEVAPGWFKNKIRAIKMSEQFLLARKDMLTFT
jgi:hypothetical protein